MAMRRLSRADRDLLGLMAPVLSVRRHHPGPGRRPAPVPDPGPVRCLTNRTAPIETSSGPRVWHRLNPRATGSSTTRCTSSPSPRSAHETPPAARTSNGNSPTGSRRRKRSGRSSAASATPSGANSRSISSVYDQRAREGKRGRLRSQRDRLCTLTGGSSTKSLPGPTGTLRPHHRACCVAPETPRLTAKRLRSATGDDTECRDRTTSSPSPSPHDEWGRCAPTASRY
jgi:hypothetical protein